MYHRHILLDLKLARCVKSAEDLERFETRPRFSRPDDLRTLPICVGYIFIIIIIIIIADTVMNVFFYVSCL
jgi:hypothetical protein